MSSPRPFSIILAMFLLVVHATPSLAGSKEICRAIFKHSRHNYVDLESDPDLSPTLKEQILRARVKVIASYGHLPQLQETNLTGISDIKLFPIDAETIRGNAFAYLSYNVDRKTLNINMTFTEENLRNKGFSELLLSEILARHPDVRRIHVSDLVGTNLKIFEGARETMKKKAAIRETYAYKQYSKFGFTKLKNIEISKGVYQEMVLGGAKQILVLEAPAIAFDLEIPR